jgi:hypothetical protein
VLTILGSGLVLRGVSEHGPDLVPPPEVGAISTELRRKQFPIAPIDFHALPSIVNIALRQGCGRSVREENVSTDLFQRRAAECRHLAAAARDDSDKAFWLGLVERWQTLENQKAQQPARDKSRSPLRRQAELAAVD